MMARTQGGSAVTPLSQGMESTETTPERVSVKAEEATERCAVTPEEHLKVLLRMEAANYPLCKDYLSNGDPEADASDKVSEGWRRKLCEWCFEVVDHFNFDREVVSYALDFLDRAVASRTESTKAALPKREFQLLAVTSLYTAIKLHGETDEREGPRRKLRIGAFVELSRGFFQIDVIERSEREILESLQWHVNPPTCLRFTATMLRLCPKWSPDEHLKSFPSVMGAVYDVARYLTELSVCVSSFAFTCKTSVTSYASILCAIEALEKPMPLPSHPKEAFFEEMARVTGLLPSDPEVVRIVSKLKTLCPAMFQVKEGILEDAVVDKCADKFLASFDDRDSPVCVIDTPNQEESPRSRRKRSCPSEEEEKDDHRPIHRSSFS